MACKVLEGVQMDACLDQEQRHQYSKQMSRVVWMLREDDPATKADDPATKDLAYVAGVCISPMGYILTSSHVVKHGVKYVGSCRSWKAGWTSVRVVKRSMAYGLSLLQLEGKNRKKADYTSVAESEILNVNQQVYGFGHPNLFQVSCINTFVRGSVEYPCEDIADLPACLNDLDQPVSTAPRVGLKFDYVEAQALSPRTVKHLQFIIDVDTFRPETISLMQQGIPLIQIKNFHLAHCGGPVICPFWTYCWYQSLQVP